MDPVETNVVVGGYPAISVKHAVRRSLDARERTPTTIESLDENDTLTEVLLGDETRTLVARVHWCSAYAFEFGVAYIPERQRLFVGAGQVVGVIDLAKQVVVELDYVQLFFSFERVSRGIVRYGELECVLYSPKGEVLERASVDPPYTVSRSPSKISFSSMGAGETSLEVG